MDCDSCNGDCCPCISPFSLCAHPHVGHIYAPGMLPPNWKTSAVFPHNEKGVK